MFDKLLEDLPKGIQVLILLMLLAASLTWLFAKWERGIEKKIEFVGDVRAELNLRIDGVRQDLGALTRDRWTCTQEREQNFKERIFVCQVSPELCNEISWPEVSCPAMALQGR